MMGPETQVGFEALPQPTEMEAVPLTGSDLSGDRHLLSAVPAAVDSGGDPLLHPPPSPSSSSSSSSPSSSSSFLDPPFYADAVFSPLDVPITGDPSADAAGGGGDGRGDGQTTPSASARSCRAAASEYSKIAVSDPQKEQEPTASSSLVPGSGTFVSYLITTRLSASAAAAAGGPTEFRVRRRFRDVVTLADRLAEAYRGFFIPPRPDKSVVESQVMQKHEFVEQRRKALERYLWRLAAHPVIGRSEELREFLTAPGRLPLPPTPDVASRVLDGAARLPKQLFGESGAGAGYVAVPQDAAQPAKGGRDLLRIFKELKHSVAYDWGGVKPAVVEEDKEFVEKKAKVQELEQQLTTTSQQAEALVKAQQDMGETMGELGLAFIKLAKFETEQAVHNSQRMRAADVKCLATAAVKASRFYRESNAQTVKHLDTLHEYLGLMLAVHSAFADRSSALLTVQTVASELSSLHAKAEKLEAASSKIFGADKSRYVKLEELKETIRITEDAKSVAFREYERIKDNNRNELQRLDRERHDDFLTMMKRFIGNQVDYAEKIANVWTKVAEETSGYARKGN